MIFVYSFTIEAYDVIDT